MSNKFYHQQWYLFIKSLYDWVGWWPSGYLGDLTHSGWCSWFLLWLCCWGMFLCLPHIFSFPLSNVFNLPAKLCLCSCPRMHWHPLPVVLWPLTSMQVWLTWQILEYGWKDVFSILCFCILWGSELGRSGGVWCAGGDESIFLVNTQFCSCCVSENYFTQERMQSRMILNQVWS